MSNLAIFFIETLHGCCLMQKIIQLKSRQRAAKKSVEERREAMRLVQRRKAEEQRQAAIKIQSAAKEKRDRVSDASMFHIGRGPWIHVQECRSCRSRVMCVPRMPPTLERTVEHLS